MADGHPWNCSIELWYYWFDCTFYNSRIVKLWIRISIGLKNSMRDGLKNCIPKNQDSKTENIGDIVMKKNDVFTFTAPNGVKVTAVVVNEVADEIHIATHTRRWLCYAQNRFFTYEESKNIFHEDRPSEWKYGKVIVDYAVIPEYDRMLEEHQHEIVMANDYADKIL